MTARSVLMAVCVLTMSPAAAQEPGRSALDVNDVSFLWPVPKNAVDVAALVSADDPVNGSTLWPKAAFESMLALAEATSLTSSAGELSKVALEEFREALLRPQNWKVVGVRVDPCAPGCDRAIAAVFGAAPQVRLIFQPVTLGAGGTVIVHDMAAHLVFNFTQGNPRPPFTPDRVAFQRVVDDLVAIKAVSEKGNAPTAGPLRIHPGLAAGVPGVADRLKKFVSEHLTPNRLFAGAFMGLAPPPEPWLFLSLVGDGNGRFIPAPQVVLGRSPAQMLTFRSTREPVVPVPVTTNLDAARGVSTAALFLPNPNIDSRVFPELDRPLLRDVPDVIANPGRAHFFNTDCVSCHTESTRRAAGMAASDRSFAFAPPPGVSGESAHLPATRWNVRNFGWFQARVAQPIAPTVSQRTANEAAESASQINAQYLSGNVVK